MMKTFGDSYLRALSVLGVKDVRTSGSSYAPTSALNRDTEKVAAYYRYTTTDLDLDADTFKEAISKGKYKKDECFINSIYDFYGDNLMRPDKKRNVINRETILKTIGKTEENVKNGLSIQDVMPFFEKHRLHLRVFDKFYKVVHKYAPDNHYNNKVMYCLQMDGHIYTLNHDVKRIEQKQNEDDEEDTYSPKVGDTYYINEEAKPRQAKIISNVDDILDVTRNMPQPEGPREQ